MPGRTALTGLRLLAAAVILCLLTSPTLSAPAELARSGQFGAAARLHPGEAALYAGGVQAALRGGDAQQAEAIIRLWAAREGWNAELITLLSQAAASRSTDGALLRVRALAAHSGSAEELRTALSQDLALRDWESARGHLNALRAIPDGVAIIQKDPALAALATALSAPDDEPALRSLGATLLAQERYALAEYIYGRLITLDGGSAPSMALAAYSQEAQGRDGWPLISVALGLAPNDTTANYAAALHWRIRGDYDRALAALAIAGRSAPTNPAIAVETGTVYRLRGEPAEAARWYQQAVRLAPDDPGVYRALLAFTLDDGYQVDAGALALARDAAARFPQDAELHALYGQALLTVGPAPATAEPGPTGGADPREEARFALEGALRLDAANLRAQFYLAVYWDQTGQRERARGAYQQIAAHTESPFAAMAARALGN